MNDYRSQLIPLFLITLIFLCVIIGLQTYVPDHHVRNAFARMVTTFENVTRITITVAGIGLTILVLGALLWLGWIAWNSGVFWYYSGRMRRAEAQLAEREANVFVTVAPPGSQVYRTVANSFNAVTAPLHLEPGWINGTAEVITPEQSSRWTIDKVMNAQIRGSRSRNLLPETEEQIELKPVLDLIRNEPCVAFWGGRGSGKTTIALHWLAHSRNENYVIDPKPLGLNPWPNAKVIGASGNFDEVEPSIERIYGELLHRQKNGLLNESPITLLVDELYTLVHVHKLAIMESVFAIITLGREYGVHAGFTSSAKGVKMLRIEGMSGLAEALTFVHLYKIGAEYKAFVDMGEGEIEAIPPGPYVAREQTPRQIAATIPMSEDEAIAKVIKNNPGASYGKIIKLANIGGSRPTATGRVKEVIEKFNLEEYEIGGKFPVNGM